MHRPAPRTPLSTRRSATPRLPDPSARARPGRSRHASPDVLIAPPPRLRDRLAARFRAGRLDAVLAAGVPPETDAALALRAQRLTTRGERSGLARSVRRSLDDARPGGGHLRVAVARRRVRESEGELALLARRLAAPEPVSARGVALTRSLLVDGSGPLYDDRSGDDLGEVARRAADALLLGG